MTDYDHVWFWRARPVYFTEARGFVPDDRKGQDCRVVARGALGSVLVEFADGHRVVTSRYAVRKKKGPPPGGVSSGPFLAP